jgi:membrane protein required for colicin V production
VNHIDIIFLVPIIWLAYRGFRHGFIIELASLAGLIAGIYAAIYYCGRVEHLLVLFFDMDTRYLPVIAFVIVFIVVVVVVYLLGKILENFVNMIALGFLNKIAGGIFGILKAALFLSIIIIILTHINDRFISEDRKENSVLYKPISALAPFLWKKLGNSDFIMPGKEEQMDGQTDEV